jgi:hypothetical protein
VGAGPVPESGATVTVSDRVPPPNVAVPEAVVAVFDPCLLTVKHSLAPFVSVATEE